MIIEIPEHYSGPQWDSLRRIKKRKFKRREMKFNINNKNNKDVKETNK